MGLLISKRDSILNTYRLVNTIWTLTGTVQSLRYYIDALEMAGWVPR